MDIKKGRRKSFDIEYVYVTEENIKEIAEWCGGIVGGEGKDVFIKIIDKGAINTMQTKAFLGDIIVHHLDMKSFKKFGRKSFNKSYEEVVASGVKEREDDRSSVTGQYVTEKFAHENPDTTEHETTELPRDADPS